MLPPPLTQQALNFQPFRDLKEINIFFVRTCLYIRRCSSRSSSARPPSSISSKIAISSRCGTSGMSARLPTRLLMPHGRPTLDIRSTALIRPKGHSAGAYYAYYCFLFQQLPIILECFCFSLGRCILEFEALVLTAQQVAETRRGTKEAERAIDVLQFLSPEAYFNMCSYCFLLLYIYIFVIVLLIVTFVFKRQC